MFYPARKSKLTKSLPSYETVRLKTKNVKDKFVESVKDNGDSATWGWFDEDKILSKATTFTYISLLMGILNFCIAFCEIVFLAKVPIIAWLVLIMLTVLSSCIPNSLWAGLIIASSRKHGDTITQTMLQLIRNSMFNINVFFWFVFLISGSFVTFLVDYTRNDLSLISSVDDASLFGPSPYALQILFLFLVWNMIAGALSLCGLIYHIVLDKNNSVNLRFEGGN